jgi:hypothetical protein
VRTIDGNKYTSSITCMAPMRYHTQLIVTGGKHGDVHLWDIDEGAHACTVIPSTLMINAGVHLRKVTTLEHCVNKIDASSSRLVCTLDYDMNVAVVQFHSETCYSVSVL